MAQRVPFPQHAPRLDVQLLDDAVQHVALTRALLTGGAAVFLAVLYIGHIAEVYGRAIVVRDDQFAIYLQASLYSRELDRSALDVEDGISSIAI